MARPGIGFTDVVRAAQSVIERGEEPTIDRVRDELGTGSKSTIAPHLKRWKFEYQQQSAWDSIPDELAVAAKAVFEKSQRLAQEKIDALNSSHVKAIETLMQQLNSLEQDGLQKTRQLAELINTKQNLEEEVKKLSDENRSLDLELSKLNQQALAHQNFAMQLKESLQTSQDEKRELLKQFEHYQTASAQERKEEKRSYEFTNQKLETQLDKHRSEAETLRRDLALSTAKQDRTHAENTELKTKLTDTEKDNALLRAKNQMIVEANEQLAATQQTLNDTLLNLSNKISVSKALERQTIRELISMKTILTTHVSPLI